MDFCLIREQLRVNCKKPRPWFEIGSSNLFPMTITVTLIVHRFLRNIFLFLPLPFTFCDFLFSINHYDFSFSLFATLSFILLSFHPVFHLTATICICHPPTHASIIRQVHFNPLVIHYLYYFCFLPHFKYRITCLVIILLVQVFSNHAIVEGGKVSFSTFLTINDNLERTHFGHKHNNFG